MKSTKPNYEIELYKSEIERLKLELEMEKYNKPSQMSSSVANDITELVQVASEMRKILNEIRNMQLNINIAKRIDAVLRWATIFD